MKKTARGRRGPSVTTEKKAGLTLPVSRVAKRMKEIGRCSRVSKKAAVIICAAAQCFLEEMLEVPHLGMREIITSKHLRQFIERDPELSEHFYQSEPHIMRSGMPVHNVRMFAMRNERKKIKKVKTVERPKKTVKPAKKSMKKTGVAPPVKQDTAQEDTACAAPMPQRRVLEATPTAGRRGTGHKWQYVENDQTWRDYRVDASAVVEQHFHEWEQDGKGSDIVVRAVKSGDWSYDVCFKTLQQTNVDHQSHTKRRIRRVALSEPTGGRVS
eukprot:TRINITY_DN3688_c0_g1_i1.p1 TRINITY_DN3688_c0_g1~~TRINITY_DN3688_c0_g1_i1.p1  ORF type:complete len:270 (+),score=38.44 TRINITY_DN3688_c0_g1_i1:76-885(+)